MNNKIDMETMRLIALFEQVTKARVKDSFTYKERLTFVVEQGQLWRALGKNRANLLKLEGLLKQRIKIVEFHPERVQFLVNLLHPLKVIDIQEDGDVITVKGPDTKTKGLMIGARAQNLRATEEVMRKYFPCEEIKVI